MYRDDRRNDGGAGRSSQLVNTMTKLKKGF